MEYKGKLEEFPQEVVGKMLDKQEHQGNKRALSVFEKNPASNVNDGGFTWSATVEGIDFWHEVISKRRFDLFFEKYPKRESHFEKQNNVELKITTPYTNHVVKMRLSPGEIVALKHSLKSASLGKLEFLDLEGCDGEVLIIPGGLLKNCTYNIVNF